MKGFRDMRGKIEGFLNELNDPEKMKEYGMYMVRDGHVVATKVQDVFYPEMTRNVRSEEIERIVSRVNMCAIENDYDEILQSGLIFLVPYDTILPIVPGDYLSVRIDKYANKVIFVDQINMIYGVPIGSTKRDYGVCLFVCGVLSPCKLEDLTLGDGAVINEYEYVLNYLNDFITACGLIVHDHALYKVTRKLLPDRVKYFDLDLRRESPLSEMREFGAGHINNLMDLRAKRLLPREIVDNVLPKFCEILPFHHDVRYCLDLAIEAMCAFCIEDYKKCLVNSDLFAEFSMKIIWEKIPGLAEEKMPDKIYGKSGTKSISGMIADKLGVRGDSVFGRWASKSRTARNDFVHQMKLDNFEEKKMQEIMKYNFELIRLFVEKMGASDDDPVSLLGAMGGLYEYIYEK